jgi:type I restriction enzyme S subunit
MTIKTDNWQTYEFGDLARNLTVAVKDPLSEGYERYVGLEHIEPGNMHIKSWGNVADGTTFTRVFKKGQVLFGKRRAYQRKAALAEFDGVCSGDILVFEANEENVISELLPFVVQGDKFFDHAIKTSAGSLSPRTKFKDLAKLKFKLPPKPEQKSLADLLWNVDEVVEKWKGMLCGANIFCSSLIKDIFRQKEEVTTQEVGSFVKIRTGKLDVNAGSEDGKYPFFSCAQEILKIDNYEYDCECVLVAGNGDLNAKYYNGKFNAYQRTYIIESLNKERVNNKYLFYFYQYFIDELKHKAVGGVIKYLRMANLTELPLPIISLKEQKAVVNQIDGLKAIIKQACSQKDLVVAIKNEIINQIFG